MRTSENPLVYRIAQLISFLLGIRVFVLVFFAFTLYVSTFFLFSQEESLRRFVFDYKVHGIIVCSVLSIAAGGLINQFYDLEKDRLQRPFRSKLQRFLKQKYFLYSYVVLNAFSLGVAGILSFRIFIFFVVYQFLMWFYSHKLSKLLVWNNLVFVSLTLYPFFGMLVYYRHFSQIIFLMAVFLFISLLIIDLIKDILTMRPDAVFGYRTLPIAVGVKGTVRVLGLLLVLNAVLGLLISSLGALGWMDGYFLASSIVFLSALYPLVFFRLRRVFWLLNLLRLWVFVGVLFMLFNGVSERGMGAFYFSLLF
ncbi:UbiA family prenyltransferase [Bergeyella sp. RCAD1439]|uniref:UbiA family prenyltransferase n=1 Tax=Bergeyella anatis TaxID=3113737 RepID=UPI002E18EDBC|nr:UbiA family prenyltransferase [Bergeyella sp. RCAD1439]